MAAGHQFGPLVAIAWESLRRRLWRPGKGRYRGLTALAASCHAGVGRDGNRLAEMLIDELAVSLGCSRPRGNRE